MVIRTFAILVFAISMLNQNAAFAQGQRSMTPHEFYLRTATTDLRCQALTSSPSVVAGALKIRLDNDFLHQSLGILQVVSGSSTFDAHFPANFELNFFENHSGSAVCLDNPTSCQHDVNRLLGVLMKVRAVSARNSVQRNSVECAMVLLNGWRDQFLLNPESKLRRDEAEMSEHIEFLESAPGKTTAEQRKEIARLVVGNKIDFDDFMAEYKSSQNAARAIDVALKKRKALDCGGWNAWSRACR